MRTEEKIPNRYSPVALTDRFLQGVNAQQPVRCIWKYSLFDFQSTKMNFRC